MTEWSVAADSADGETRRSQEVVAVTIIAVTAALFRLIPLQWLHPLNWDELEFYRATSWIGEGRLPFRDFWEHHTPLMWFLFAPFTWLTESAGVTGVIALRWAQIPVWIATFWLTNLYMRGAGIARFARWAAMAVALCSSLLMIPAVEYRVDSLGCALVMAGLVLAQRKAWFAAGAVFCLAGLANLRLGPVLVVAVLFLLFRERLRSIMIAVGGFVTLTAFLSVCLANRMLSPLYQQVWADNLAEKYAMPVIGGFIHRLLVPFGVRIIASDRLFDLAAVDVGGIAVLVAGFAGLLLALRKRGDLLLVGLLQLTNLAFVASMKFIYNYHFALVVILMIPLIALVVERVRRRGVVIAILAVAWSVNAFASVFRGKELDRAYQDLIMREAEARTVPGDQVWSGITWALNREPAYRFWFLPELARQLVRQRLAPGYVVRQAPAAVVLDYNALLWLGTVQRELAPFFVRNYIPVWRELWVPAMNGRVAAGTAREWVVPRDGEYRVYASTGFARHPWFTHPLLVASYKKADASRLTLKLPPPSHDAAQFFVDGRPVDGDVLRLIRGQHVAAMNAGGTDVGVILLSTGDRVLFRQPPPGVTLEGETTRITHVPHIGARLEP